MSWRFFIATACLATPLFSQTPPPTAEETAFFERNIRPIFANHCYGCHSAKLDKPMSGLLLDSRAGIARGGKTGAPVIVAGKPDESLLIIAVRRAGALKMPPGTPLEPYEIGNLVAWIKMGAPDPRNDAAPAAAPASNIDWDKAHKHWSYQPVTDPAPPAGTGEWAASPVDRFIKAKLDEKKLTPNPRAAKLALIRRVTYDLTGLPPALEQVDAFVKDTSPNAFEKVVDRLLASPQYGERWGRHWLDVVRYADTAGDNADFPVPSLYRYRNWVIAAFNRDMPYNEFVRDQIAGDIIAAKQDLAKKDIEAWQSDIVATGYLANSRRFGSRAAEMFLTIDDTIDNLGKGFLGLSIGCARCHDHKFDPIPSTDYYALYGIFKSTIYAHPGTEIYPHTYGFVALNPAQSDTLKRWETDLSGLDNHIEDMKAGKIKFQTDAERRKAEQDDQATLRRLSNQYPYLAKAYAVTEGTPANQKLMIRGEPRALGAEVPRGFLTILGGAKIPSGEKGSGRLELADWIADPKNPLTARVIVNRVWEWHFGRGIVATPDDFGARGEPPSHPELLDYLTSRFIESGWSIKKLHKLIVLSRAYQTSSADNTKNDAIDSRNAYLWKFSRRRLEAEEYRDSLLAVSGNLDLAPASEQPFPPEMQWRYTQHTPFIANYDTNKRSVYLMQQRIRRQPFLDLFDGPDPNSVTGVRPVTTTALQALFTMNDPFFHAQADTLAVRVGMNYNTDAERLRYAYRLLYGRVPAPDEIKEDLQFLTAARKSLQGTAVPDYQWNRQAWSSLMRVLLSSNEFITLD